MTTAATQHNELRQRFLDEVREMETVEELQGSRVEMVKMELEAESDEDVKAMFRISRFIATFRCICAKSG